MQTQSNMRMIQIKIKIKTPLAKTVVAVLMSRMMEEMRIRTKNHLLLMNPRIREQKREAKKRRKRYQVTMSVRRRSYSRMTSIDSTRVSLF